MPPATKRKVIAMAVVALVLIAGPLVWMLYIGATTVEIEAVVIDAGQPESSTIRECHPTVRYEVDDEVFKHYFTGSQPCVMVGATMTVLVSRGDPGSPYGLQSTQLFPVIGIAVGVVIGLVALASWRRQRRYGPYSGAVADLEQAETSWWVRGTAASVGELLEHPLTGEPCIAWYAKLIAIPQYGREELELAGICPFAIEDGGSSVRVEAGEGSVVQLAERSAVEDSREVSDRLAALVRGTELEPTLEKLAVHWHWRIEAIEPGEGVQVIGRYVDGDGGPPRLDHPADRPLEVSNKSGPIA